MSIEEYPYFKEMGYCYDCPFYGDGDEDWAGKDCPYLKGENDVS